MISEAEKIIDELNRLDVTGFGPDWIRAARVLADAVAMIERMTPKTYPMEAIKQILNRNQHRKTKTWVIYTLAEADYYNSTPVGFQVFANDDGDILETWEANLIAHAYEVQSFAREKEAGVA